MRSSNKAIKPKYWGTGRVSRFPFTLHQDVRNMAEMPKELQRKRSEDAAISRRIKKVNFLT